jgi:hypothetical protein
MAAAVWAYNSNVRRRQLLTALLLAPVLARGAEDKERVRGKLEKGPALRTSDGKLVALKGDEDTVGVLNDARLAGSDFEVTGKAEADGAFTINPIHTRAIFVYKDGKRLMVTYWCDVCAIRTYTPGICWCCRDETALDLMDADKVSTK